MPADIHAVPLILRRAGNSADKIFRFQNDGPHVFRFFQKLVGGGEPRGPRAR